MSNAGLRERVLSAASGLFYAEGITATGVDRVAEVAGISKRTLYKYFGSKDLLVAECLRAWDVPIREHFTMGAEAVGPDPRRQLEALFTGLVGWLARPDFRGCPYLNAAAEIPDPAAAARQVARDHKDHLREWIRERAHDAGLVDPDIVSWQLMALFDGALSQRLVLGAAASGEAVVAAAGTLIDAARPRAG